MAGPSLEKLLTVNSSRRGDPQLDIVQRVRDFEALSPKWDAVIKALPQGSRIFTEEEA